MDHPCKGMSKEAIAAFERLAVCEMPIATSATLVALEKRGVIVRGPDLVKRDARGEYNIARWDVPIHIHAQWCAWCSENLEDDTQC